MGHYQAVVRAGVLVIPGGWSPGYVAVGELTAKLLQGRHTIVPSPSHFVQFATPAAFNDAVNAFHARSGKEAAQRPLTGGGAGRRAAPLGRDRAGLRGTSHTVTMNDTMVAK